MAHATTYILHGWTQDTKKWDPFIKTLKKQGITAKLLGIPGLSAPLDKPWKLDNYSDWLRDQIGDETNVNIIAHSFGGRVAIRCHLKNPLAIKKLVLIDSAGIRPANFAAILKRASFKALAKIGKRFTNNPQARRLLYSVIGEKDYYKANKILAQTMANVIEEDQTQELEHVKAHTLLIWGSKDTITPLADGRTMNKVITGSCLKIIDGAGHSPQYTHVEQTVPLVATFLKG